MEKFKNHVPHAANVRFPADPLTELAISQSRLAAARMRGEGLGVATVPLTLPGKLSLELHFIDARLGREDLVEPHAFSMVPKAPLAASVPGLDELLRLLKLRKMLQGSQPAIPYIGDDRKYYNTPEALRQANEIHRDWAYRLEPRKTAPEVWFKGKPTTYKEINSKVPVQKNIDFKKILRNL